MEVKISELIDDRQNIFENMEKEAESKPQKEIQDIDKILKEEETKAEEENKSIKEKHQRKITSVRGTIGQVLKDRLEELNSIKTEEELDDFVEDILKDIDDRPKRVFMAKWRTKQNFQQKFIFVYNTELDAEGYSLIRSRR